jgi:hypothetical protein
MIVLMRPVRRQNRTPGTDNRRLALAGLVLRNCEGWHSCFDDSLGPLIGKPHNEYS